MEYSERLKDNNITFSPTQSNQEKEQNKAKYIKILKELEGQEQLSDVETFCALCRKLHVLDYMPNLSYDEIYTMGCIADIYLHHYSIHDRDQITPDIAKKIEDER